MDHMSSSTSFEVALVFQGRSKRLSDVTTETTGESLEHQARLAFQLDDDDTIALRMLYKGKTLQPDHQVVFTTAPRKTPKVLLMATSQQRVETLNAKRSDPTIRGFDQEVVPNKPVYKPWGDEYSQQDKEYKFCRFQACTWQSFGHRADQYKTPHAFHAMQLLERLATDPGVVAIMVERELVVGTLGEMDPIDDRLKRKKQQEGACLLGYNTNAGARIDVKLRPDHLEGFLPYSQIVCTLIHELSHNWVSEHNYLFWTNYGQMRVEYLHRHATMAASGTVVNGKTTGELAGVQIQGGMQSIATMVLEELKKEMAPHGLQRQEIAPAILQRCDELTQQYNAMERGQRVGGSDDMAAGSARERALAAAERRASQKHNDESKKK